MDFKEINKQLLHFIAQSPNAFFATDCMRKMLLENDYTELFEQDAWTVQRGGRYFVTRNQSSLIAFQIPTEDCGGFQILASHSDSPAFKIKANAEIEVEKKYVKLNTEKYGGMLCAPWLDRPLSVAGRVILSTPDGITAKLVNIDRDLVIIPNLAIHMNRKANDGYTWNAQKDLLPLFADVSSDQTLLALIAEELSVSEEAILDTDLFLYNRMQGTTIGAAGEYIACARLDDLQCAFASLLGFLQATPQNRIAVHCVLDNEEVGSTTKQGAAAHFLYDTLHRIYSGVGHSEEDFLRAFASSLMLSADNAHAVHPNHTDLSDPTNRPYLNEGIVIKYSANQKYTTDAVSAALFKKICEHADVPYQTFTNRSDQLGGSTLGNISQTQVALNTVDIGLPQLSMHSPYETAGAKDTAYLVQAAKVFFSASIEAGSAGEYHVRFI